MMIPSPKEPVYSRVQLRPGMIDGFGFVSAETASLRDAGVTRDHLRIIGLGSLAVSGHPIVYSDSYTTQDDELYVYARHRVDQRTFFPRLDFFFDEALPNFSELAGKPLHCIFQIEGQFLEVDIPLPIALNLEVPPERIDFVRVFSPLGDVAVEFTDRPIIRSDESAFTQRGFLARRLESPLFGFDASRSDIWPAFLADIHWASEFIPKETLQHVIASAARTRVTV